MQQLFRPKRLGMETHPPWEKVSGSSQTHGNLTTCKKSGTPLPERPVEGPKSWLFLLGTLILGRFASCARMRKDKITGPPFHLFVDAGDVNSQDTY